MVLYIHGCGDNGQKLSPNQLEFSSFHTPKACNEISAQASALFRKSTRYD